MKGEDMIYKVHLRWAIPERKDMFGGNLTESRVWFMTRSEVKMVMDNIVNEDKWIIIEDKVASKETKKNIAWAIPYKDLIDFDIRLQRPEVTKEEDED